MYSKIIFYHYLKLCNLYYTNCIFLHYRLKDITTYTDNNVKVDTDQNYLLNYVR